VDVMMAVARRLGEARRWRDRGFGKAGTWTSWWEPTCGERRWGLWVSDELEGDGATGGRFSDEKVITRTPCARRRPWKKN